MFEVVVRERGAEPVVLRFSKSEITVGRVRGNDVVLPKNSVSKRHAKIIEKDGRFIAVDQGSTNGTIVGGRKIAAPQLLQEGDKVVVGDYVLAFSLLDAEAGAEATSDAPEPTPEAAEVGTSDASAEAEPASAAEEAPSEPVQKTVSVSSRGADEHRATEPAKALPPRAAGVSASPATMRMRVPSDLLGAGPGRSAARVRGEAVSMEFLSDSGFLEAHQRCAAMLSAIGKELPKHYPPREADMNDLRAQIETWTADIEDLSEDARRVLVRALVHEATALGPVEFYLDDPGVSEVHVNRHDVIYARRAGALERMPLGFGSAETLEAAARRVLRSSGIRDPLGGSCRLADGLRIELVMPPAAASEPVLTVKKPARPEASMSDLIEQGFLSQEIADALTVAASYGGTVLVASQNPADGSTLLNALVGALPPTKRVVTVEAAPNLAEGSDAVVRLEHTKVGELSSVSRARMLEPEVLAVDPIDQRSAADWLDSASSQDCATLATLAARSPTDALARLVIHALEGRRTESSAVRRQITANLDLIVHIRRNHDGTALVGEVVEVTANERGELHTTSVFRSKSGPSGLEFAASGHVPSFFASLREAGETFDGNMFNA